MFFFLNWKSIKYVNLFWFKYEANTKKIISFIQAEQDLIIINLTVCVRVLCEFSYSPERSLFFFELVCMRHISKGQTYTYTTTKVYKKNDPFVFIIVFKCYHHHHHHPKTVVLINNTCGPSDAMCHTHSHTHIAHTKQSRREPISMSIYTSCRRRKKNVNGERKLYFKYTSVSTT